MDTPSPEPRSWDNLIQQARSAPAPAGIDLRVAIRTEITSFQIQSPQAASLYEDVVSLFTSRWLQTGFAFLTVAAFLACLESRDVINELAWIWQFQGPVLTDI